MLHRPVEPAEDYGKYDTSMDIPSDSSGCESKFTNGLGEDRGAAAGHFRPTVDEDRLAYYWYLSAEERKKFDENWPGIVKRYTDTTDEFAVAQMGRPQPIVDRLPDAPHYFYFNDQAFVVRVMREFLLGNVGP